METVLPQKLPLMVVICEYATYVSGFQTIPKSTMVGMMVMTQLRNTDTEKQKRAFGSSSKGTQTEPAAAFSSIELC